MIFGEIRYRYRMSKMRHPHAWLGMWVVLYTNAGAFAIITAYNAGLIK